MPRMHLKNMTYGEKPYAYVYTYVMSPFFKKVPEQAKFIHAGKQNWKS